MGRAPLNLAGNRYGSLVPQVIAPRDDWIDRKVSWICLCDCGRLAILKSESIVHRSAPACPECSPRGGKVPQTLKPCQGCKNLFYGSANARRCDDCEVEHLKEYQRQYAREEYQRKLAAGLVRPSPKVMRACEVCGEEFEVRRARLKYTCSPPCSKERERRKMREYNREYYERRKATREG